MLQLYWLDQLTLADRPQTGGKAAVLGELKRAGLPVPPGFCIPPGALATLDRPQGELWEQIRSAYRRLVGELCLPGWQAGEAPLVAVRSSGVNEDGPTQSYAGLYETVLNVAGEMELWAAIQRCRRAAASGRVQAYRSQARPGPAAEDVFPETGGASEGSASAGGASPDFAVLIQAQAPAQVSGVLFTVNPLNGSNRELLIEATPGLGEALVGGQIAPISYQIDRQSRRRPAARPGLLKTAQLASLAGLAGQVEDLLGPGQDIEWAVAGGRVYLLQARPVTTLRHVGAAIRRPAASLWTRANVGEVLPHVVTPLTWSIFTQMLLARQPASPASAADSAGENAGALRQFRGRVYLRLDAFLNTFCYLPGVTPRILTQVLGVELPSDLQAYNPPDGPAVRLAQGLFYLDLHGMVNRLERLSDALPARPENDDEPALLEWVSRAFQIHLKATAYAIAAYALLDRWLHKWAGAKAAGMLPNLLLGEQDLQTAAQGYALWDLTHLIRQNWPLKRLVETSRSWPELAGLAGVVPGGSQFLIGMERFLQANGARAAGEFELATPRWREDPSFLLDVLRKYLARDESHVRTYGERRSRQQAILSDLQKCLPPAQRRLLPRFLAAYRRYATQRENLKYRLMEGYASLRSHYVTLGRRLHREGRLPDAGAIFYLSVEQISRLARAPQTELPAFEAVIAAARAQDGQWRALPPLDDLVDDQGQPVESAGALQGDCSLSGIAASPGRVAGWARVLQDVDQLSQLQPGEILVTPHTDPGWTPIFMSCSAVVTEIGGFLSHGATVAREYGLPCVVNVSGATARIHTGDWIQVDGNHGQVTICPPQEITI